MDVDLPRLILGLGLFVAVAGWILSDWRVRSARSVVLLITGLVVGAAFALASDSALMTMLGGLVGVGFAAPVLLRHRFVMPLAGPDAAMAGHIDATERELVRAGRRFRRNPTSLSDYASNLEAIRRRLRRVQPPDDEWRSLLGQIDDEIAGTVVLASARGGHNEVRAKREAIRRHYRELIRPRLRFWR